MLLILTEYLAKFYSGFHVFQYLTLRGILAAVTALLMALLIGPRMISLLSHYQIGQVVRTDGPQSHLIKKGTPTMGGGLILVAMGIGTLLWADLSSRFVWVLLGTTLAFGLIGFYDDYLKLAVMGAAALGVFAYATGNVNFARYLQIPFINGVGEVLIFSATLVGAGLGFLWFNSYPAQVFMGDVGALAIGAALGTIAVIVRQEIVLAVMGGVFVLETVSVMLQVASFKLTGKRLFRMAPIHHHFELKGWPEPKVIVRFWIISLLLVLAGGATWKLR